MEGTNLGILTLIPALSFFVFAFVTRKCIFSILLSGILGYLLYYGPDFFMPTVDALLDATCDSDNNYIVLICLLCSAVSCSCCASQTAPRPWPCGPASM